jgi:hypothetical protein
MVVLVTVIALWALAQKNNGLAQGSFYIHIDSVNQFAWTIVPVLAVILIKFCWSLVDEYFRLLQPYISLAGGSASARSSICVDYVSIIEGWIIVKSILRRHYILAAVATLSLGNEVLVTAMGGKCFRSSRRIPLAFILHLNSRFLEVFSSRL